ncbi:outer membrane protein [Ancylobacter radicis]|nr:outer membrane protein [Ancylobacter radicis]
MLAVCSASAADIGSSADDLLAKAPVIEDESGWYLRGDIGYVVNETPDWSQLDFTPSVDPAIDDAWLIGLGVGVRLADWLRADLTVDYRGKADVSAQGFSADFSTATALANLYVDLGSWKGLTPYVGAGVGAGYVSLTDVELLGADIGDTDGWGVAWALMAGVVVAVAPNWQVDVGYRYLSLDSVDLGGGVPDFQQSAHEIRLGARYLID